MEKNIMTFIEKNVKKYKKLGFEVKYQRPDYVELLKRTDLNTKVNPYESKKIGEQIRVSDNGWIYKCDYMVSGHMLSGSAETNKTGNNIYWMSKDTIIEKPNDVEVDSKGIKL